MYKKIIGALVILWIASYAIWNNDDFQRKYIYPLPYQDTINHYANRYGVEPAMIAGVAMAESKFDNDINSSRGAIGIMQLMPDTAAWIAKQIDDDSYTKQRLSDPRFNIKYGTWYLAELNDEFEHNDVLVLAAYNAGRGNVREWKQQYGWNRDFKDYKQIPFPETREYVKRVLTNRYEYQRLYYSHPH